MSRRLTFFIACCIAISAPIWNGAYGAHSVDPDSFPGWPTSIEGHTLSERPFAELEAQFARDFPGRVARFSGGDDEWILRWIAEPTRRLHSTSDCYRGLGFLIDNERIAIDEQGRRWGAFDATNKTERLLVRERITAPNGAAWTDNSAWYWAAVTGHTQGPWWATTRVSWRTDGTPLLGSD